MIHRDNIPTPDHRFAWIELSQPSHSIPNSWTGSSLSCMVCAESKNSIGPQDMKQNVMFMRKVIKIYRWRKKVYSNYIHEMVLFLSVELLQERCEGIVDRLSERGEWIKVEWVMCRVLVGSGGFHGSFLFLFNIAFRFLGKSSGLLRDWGDDLLAGRCHKHLWIQQVSVTRKCAGN